MLGTLFELLSVLAAVVIVAGGVFGAWRYFRRRVEVLIVPGDADKRLLFDFTVEALWVEVLNKADAAIRPAALYFVAGKQQFKVGDFGRGYGLPKEVPREGRAAMAAVRGPVEKKLGTNIKIRAELELETGERIRSRWWLIQARKRPRYSFWGRW